MTLCSTQKFHGCTSTRCTRASYASAVAMVNIVIGLNCVLMLVFNPLLSNIHVRQPFPASLAVKKSWKKIGPGGIRIRERISHCLADSEFNH